MSSRANYILEENKRRKYYFNKWGGAKFASGYILGARIYEGLPFLSAFRTMANE
jgi:hypothetical protein